MTDEDKSYALKQMNDRNLFLNKQLKEKDKEIERLNNIINKAIEYIELAVNCTPSSTRKNVANMILINHKTMLDILKGLDKE